MERLSASERSWMDEVVREEEIEPWLDNGRDFIDEELIWRELAAQSDPSPSRVGEIIAKSRELERLDPDETAALLNCEDPELWEEMYTAGLEIKQHVYGRRIVTFAPLYISNYCVNNCAYCGFRRENTSVERKCLSAEELRQETLALIRKGHKRLIMVYGEHPKTGADFIADTLRTVYSVKEGAGEIRRANVNAA